jgi:predicted alpha/beta hydrolase
MEQRPGRTYSLANLTPSSDCEALPRRTRFYCSDGVTLAGHVWSQASARAIVIVNPATGVLVRYYHRYAKFPAEHGFEVITYDYRGIGESRPEDLQALPPSLERVGGRRRRRT